MNYIFGKLQKTLFLRNFWGLLPNLKIRLRHFLIHKTLQVHLIFQKIPKGRFFRKTVS